MVVMMWAVGYVEGGVAKTAYAGETPDSVAEQLKADWPEYSEWSMVEAEDPFGPALSMYELWGRSSRGVTMWRIELVESRNPTFAPSV